MRITVPLLLFLLLAGLTTSCDEDKYKDILADSGKPAAAPVLPLPAGSASAEAPKKRRTRADCPTNAATVTFVDSWLEDEVRRKTGKDAGDLTPADLRSVGSLNLVKARIGELDPCVFPLFTGLKFLYLGAGDYDDLSPIQGLTLLETLRAADSKVQDLKPIEKLSRLDRLDVSHSAVVDLKSVGVLVNLTELSLDNLMVSDIGPLASLKKLQKLSLRETAVKDLSPLKDLKNLKELTITGTPVDDITPIKPLMDHGMKLFQR
jgi:internalin A